MDQNLDLSRYFNALQAFKAAHPDEVIKYWKSEKAFDSMVRQFKKKEKQLARNAIKSHGSIENYTDAMIANLKHLTEVVDEMMLIGGKKEAEKAGGDGK